MIHKGVLCHSTWLCTGGRRASQSALVRHVCAQAQHAAASLHVDRDAVPGVAIDAPQVPDGRRLLGLRDTGVEAG